MQTKIVKIDEKNIDKNLLEDLAKIIRDKGLVAIPTETVYGLACNGLDQEAVEKVFKAKNRPMDNPLILHISEIDDIHPLIKEIKKEDLDILKKLWPGPLTVILKKSELIPDGVSAGLDTVAIRLPDKKLTREFIKICKVPLAAPSANLSTKPSPTNALDVYEDMKGRIDAIIDGGCSNIGLESTVVDLSEGKSTILRPGFFTREMLSSFWPDIDYDLALKNSDQIPKSPGQKYKHYAPKARVEVYLGTSEKFKKKLDDILKNRDNKIGLMIFNEDGDFYKADYIINMGSINDLDKMANILFTALRKMDHENMDLVIVHGVDEEEFGLSIMNRLKKAASGNVYKLED